MSAKQKKTLLPRKDQAGTSSASSIPLDIEIDSTIKTCANQGSTSAQLTDRTEMRGGHPPEAATPVHVDALATHDCPTFLIALTHMPKPKPRFNRVLSAENPCPNGKGINENVGNCVTTLLLHEINQKSTIVRQELASASISISGG